MVSHFRGSDQYSFDNIESESSSSSENTEMVNEQSSLDLFNQFSDYYSSAEESESIVVPVLVEVTEMNYPSLSKVKFDDCGILVIPSGPSLALFAFTAGEEPAVVCLGEAVAKRCHDSKTEVQRDGSSDGFVYVVERADGVCSVGLSTGSTGALSLCSIEKIMNSDISKKKSIKEWQLLFKSDPGGTFASMYFDNSSKLSDPALASQFDCQTFKFAE